MRPRHLIDLAQRPFVQRRQDFDQSVIIFEHTRKQDSHRQQKFSYGSSKPYCLTIKGSGFKNRNNRTQRHFHKPETNSRFRKRNAVKQKQLQKTGS